jgi:hypothetical protein
MLCDLVGSTALSVRLDPEELQDIIGGYHRCCADVIAKSGGFVARYLGDGVLAYFGYPGAYEDDAERAARAGLALVESVAKLDDRAGTASRVSALPRVWWSLAISWVKARRRSMRWWAKRPILPRGFRRWPSRGPWSSMRTPAGSSANSLNTVFSAPPRTGYRRCSRNHLPCRQRIAETFDRNGTHLDLDVFDPDCGHLLDKLPEGDGSPLLQLFH